MSKCEQWIQFMRLAKELPRPNDSLANRVFEASMKNLALCGMTVALEPGCDAPTVETRLDDYERQRLTLKTVRGWLEAIKSYKQRTGVGLGEARDEVVAYTKATYGVERFDK